MNSSFWNDSQISLQENMVERKVQEQGVAASTSLHPSCYFSLPFCLYSLPVARVSYRTVRAQKKSAVEQNQDFIRLAAWAFFPSTKGKLALKRKNK